MSTPELTGPPEAYYDEAEAKNYTARSRIGVVQTELTERAIELMTAGSEMSEQGSLILDIGCGSGLSGEVLTERGFQWVGVDISPAMLAVANDNGAEGDMILSDIGREMNFRPGSFDGAISISVVQWLCHSYAADQDPRKRLRCFFSWLYRSLAQGARAVLQFYASCDEQKDLIAKSATACGFIGGFVVDNPDSERNRKIFLILSVGTPILPGPSNGEKSYASRKKKGKRSSVKSRDWVVSKKEQQRQRGLDVRPDTKYTARRRPASF
eukprot:Protomagalhaensia_wolfi_Nauph_80__2248@NODE_2465_length_1083_cov_262_878352_g1931_i0_p1_GENE_NODE_2465_length_1083_cov_262_878352_g1931_i0NODE_2465_length_1083_cov_262_878352_g1931_i0_p1_ORF_typecomplete_len268_score46_34Methyltransf_11/PF08241_12/2_3e17Methyltransf_23/PF13489_6/1_8e14Methyltransf_25/PF13649_6/1_1e13WBS_methylT/PF12589_8/7_8e14Methyltransf_31/PF13847_6/1_2e12MetW/PF07021_12/2_7e09CMAS/PF02353_20/2_1e09Methyltransf_12/PF08242_12/1_8e07MTS/PF05175_14/2_3e07TehB/PF03848_14/9_3e07Ub